MGTSTSDFELYNYTPSTSAAALFAAVFALSLLVLSVEVIVLQRRAKKTISVTMDDRLNHSEYSMVGLSRKKPSSKFVCLIVGCGLETIGYIARAYSSKNQDKILPYVIQSMFVLVAPALIAASIYMIFGAMLSLLDCSSLSIIPARFNTMFFVCGDIFSFLLQCGGGGLMAKSSSQKTGEILAIIGLIVQLVFFGFFLLTEIRFLILARGRADLTLKFGNKWKIINWTLIVSSIFILIRCIVRTAEFCQGREGYLMSHEWTIYVFDALFMTASVWVFAVSLPFASLFDLNMVKMAVNEFKVVPSEYESRY
ncbi:RTA1 domain-containing protein [Lachancea thermotolerans CBS 6340]|uniref:KLTH0E05808p n=1 Tax=Lachancea thermotolerans (strain ATCC 56472 / CBS 6340 / NRRL Y-8284) TaxID=559295 RepID=C5DHN6_LACTC|nr:KLTH0E05808p [Lachancea thermotolerans CBS 6340]CAR23297.1 KLTH0E05808p [Lachancea thermotolerans CBS 6340]